MLRTIVVAAVAIALSGCAPAASTSPSAPAAPTIAPSVASPATGPPSPSASAAVPAERVVAHGPNQEPTTLDVPYLAARSFATGIQAAEPTLGFLSDGRILFRGWDRPPEGPVGTGTVALGSADGESWQTVFEPGRRPSHDPYLWVDPATDRVFIADLLAPGETDPELFCSVISFSDDAGATWTDSARRCTRTPEDRPRLITGRPVTSKPSGYPNIVYLCWQDADAGAGHVCAKSLDGGASFSERGGEAFPYRAECNAAFGHAAVGDDGSLWLVTVGCRHPSIAVSRNEGATWREIQAASGDGNGDGEGGIAIGPDGRIYVVWVGADRLPRLVTSPDGETWSDPIVVAPPGVRETNLATIAAAGSGRIAIAYVGSTDAPGGIQPSAPEACSAAPCVDRIGWENVTWNAYLTISLNAADAVPAFVSAILNDPAEPIVRGSCGPGRCKAEADFIDVAVAPDGTPWIAYSSCEGGRCRQSTMRGAWASGDGVVGKIEGVDLR
jgi:hypothetical protein